MIHLNEFVPIAMWLQTFIIFGGIMNNLMICEILLIVEYCYMFWSKRIRNVKFFIAIATVVFSII